MNTIRTIKDIMTSNPTYVNTDTSISEMIDKMEKYGFDHLPVLNNNGELKGIITKSDLYQKVLSLSKSTSGKVYSEKLINNTTAADFMTTNPISINVDQNLEEVFQLFYTADFHALPVMEQNNLVGIITCKDILGVVNDMQFD